MRTFSKASKRIKFTCSFLCLLLGSAADAAIVRYDFTAIGQFTEESYLLQNNRWNNVSYIEHFKDGSFSGSFTFDTSKMPANTGNTSFNYFFGPGSGAWLTSQFSVPGYVAPVPYTDGLSSTNQGAVLPLSANLNSNSFDTFSANAQSVFFDNSVGSGSDYIRDMRNTYNLITAHPTTQTDIIDGIEFPSHWGPLNTTTLVRSHDHRAHSIYTNGNIVDGSTSDQSMVQGFLTSLTRTVLGHDQPAFIPPSEAPTPLHLISDNGFDPLRPTVVITHGWQPGTDGSDPIWMSEMSSRIQTVEKIVFGLPGNVQYHDVNVIRVRWDDAFTQGSSAGELRAATAQVGYQGALLAEALGALPGKFEGGIQFVGHSLGNLVNAYAANRIASTGITIDQFTILDRPFGQGIPVDFIANRVGGDVDADIFRVLLNRGEVTWVDNYYGDGFIFPPATGAAFGNHVTALNVLYSGADHTAVHLRYADSIDNPGLCGPGGGFGCSILLNGLARAEEEKWNPGVFHERPAGNPIDINALDWLTFNCTKNTFEFICNESSPAYFWNENFTFDESSEFLNFDLMWLNKGDGDWITVSFNDEILFTFTGSQFNSTNFQSSGFIPVQDLAGKTGQLLFALNSVGERNAAFSVRNLRTLSVSAGVPEPATWLLLVLGFGKIGISMRETKRQARMAMSPSY